MIAVLTVGQFLFSCSTAEYYRFSATKPDYYQKTKAKPAATPEMEQAAPAPAAEQLASVTESQSLLEAEAHLEASAEAPKPVLFEKRNLSESKAPLVKPAVAPAEKKTIKEEEVLVMAKEKLASMTKAEKREFRKEVKNTLRDANASSNILMIILAILIPPLAVGLYEGITSRFWISLLLTLLFYIPGMIYALLVVTDTI